MVRRPILIACAGLLALPRVELESVVATGGALLSNPAWLQVLADVLGRPRAALLAKMLDFCASPRHAL